MVERQLPKLDVAGSIPVSRSKLRRPAMIASKMSLVIALVFSSIFLIAEDKSGSQIVGHWVAVNRSKGGIGSMWDFKPDGTLAMSPGAVVDMPYKFEGDTLTLPPGTTGPDARPQIIKVRVDGNNLYQKFPDGEAEMHFVRIKDGKPGDPPIVGTWKMAPPNTGDAQSPQQQAFANSTHTYTRGGTLKLRIPFAFMSGTYDSKAGIFTLNKKDGSIFKGAFHLQDGKLYLTQPDGKSEDVYVKDDLD